MAYDRYDSRRDRRDEEDRGFFERAGDEIASWFGDDEAERRHRRDERMHGDYGRDRARYNYGGWGEDSSRNRNYDRGYGRDYNRDRSEFRGAGRHRDFNRDRDEQPSYRPIGWSSSERDYRSSAPRSSGENESMSYAGYGRFGSDRSFGSGPRYDRSESPWGRDDYRATSYAGSTRDNDRHYNSWKQRQLDELDRDYDQYCRERQERFESDFGSWRKQRMDKRQHLSAIREHMDVVGNDGETIGKVDKVRGDRIILTKSDSPDNRHHSIDCSMIDSIDGDQVKLDKSAEDVKSRWDEAEDRGFFGRDNDREEHETNLNRSFSGTYES